LPKEPATRTPPPKVIDNIIGYQARTLILHRDKSSIVARSAD